MTTMILMKLLRSGRGFKSQFDPSNPFAASGFREALLYVPKSRGQSATSKVVPQQDVVSNKPPPIRQWVDAQGQWQVGTPQQYADWKKEIEAGLQNKEVEVKPQREITPSGDTKK